MCSAEAVCLRRVLELNRCSFTLKLLADSLAVARVIVPAEVCWVMDALLLSPSSWLCVHVVMCGHVLSFQTELEAKHICYSVHYS